MTPGPGNFLCRSEATIVFLRRCRLSFGDLGRTVYTPLGLLAWTAVYLLISGLSNVVLAKQVCV